MSWVLLRGRCRCCREQISARYLVVEMLTAMVFATMALRFGAAWELPAYLVGFASLLALSVMAMEHGRLRPRVFWVTLVTTGALLALAAAEGGALAPLVAGWAVVTALVGGSLLVGA